MIKKLIVLLALFSVTPGYAQDLNSGKEAFWRGDFAEAADRFRKAVNSRPRASTLWYNLGTSEAQAGRYGYAVHALEQALLLNSSDVSAKHNLEQVREAVVDGALKSGEAEGLILPGDDDAGIGLLSALAPSLLNKIFAVSWGLLFILLWLNRKTTAPGRRTATTFCGILAGLVAFSAMGLSATRAYVVEGAQFGVVVAERAVVHRGPGKRYPPQASVAAGVKVKLGGEDSGWYQVTLPDGSGAWMQQSELLPLSR